jgi:DNA-binding NarL/FixJ family response regulator
VLLVDDHSLIRMGFRLVLDAEPDIEVVGEAADGTAAVAMCSALRPDVVLMDVRMPGHDGIEATHDIVAAGLPCMSAGYWPSSACATASKPSYSPTNPG